MRLSCNGCRVLRKGCSESCIIRPCLEWLNSPEAQAHATLFLAKFYGRAGLLNLIAAGSHHLRPAIFKSLLFEACGRIVNPVEGSTGLLCSGKWHLCEAAVEAVLAGSPIAAGSETDTELSKAACDIRHLSKQKQLPPQDKIPRNRGLKRLAMKLERTTTDSGSSGVSQIGGEEDVLSAATVFVDDDDDEPPRLMRLAEVCDLGLDLTLGHGPSNADVKDNSSTTTSNADLALGLGVVCQ